MARKRRKGVRKERREKGRNVWQKVRWSKDRGGWGNKGREEMGEERQWSKDVSRGGKEDGGWQQRQKGRKQEDAEEAF